MKPPNAMAIALASKRNDELAEIRRRAADMLARMPSIEEFKQRAPSEAAVTEHRCLRAELEAVVRDPARGTPVLHFSRGRTPR